jgi:hypothetical protein
VPPQPHPCVGVVVGPFWRSFKGLRFGVGRGIRFEGRLFVGGMVEVSLVPVNELVTAKVAGNCEIVRPGWWISSARGAPTV